MGQRRDLQVQGTRAHLERHLERIGHALYGAVPRVQRLHSENSYVCRLHFGQGLPDRVCKYARANAPQVLREQAILRALDGAGLPVPAVEFTQDDCPFDTSPFFTMPCLAEASLQQACLSRAPWANAMLLQAGRFLARLSALSSERLLGDAAPQLAPPPIARRPPPVEEWALFPYLRPAEAELVASHLDTVAGLLDETGDLAHGSYSPAHILCDAAGTFGVIDWENATGGSVLRDVGHLLAALAVWAGGDPADARSFLDGFRSERPLSAADRRKVHQWALFTSLVWANFFAGRGQSDTAGGVLQIARLYLNAPSVLLSD